MHEAWLGDVRRHVEVQIAGAAEATRDQRRPVWFDAFLLGTVVFAVFAATASYHDPLNNDAHAASVAAWQLAHHGNATLTGFHGQVSWLYSVHGREVTNRLPGTIFWATPFYAVLGPRGYPTVYPAAVAACAASALAVSLAFVLCCRLVGRRTALVAAGALAFATATWTVSADQLWTHGPAQAAVLLTLLLATSDRWLLAGLPAGFAVLVRPHLGVIALILGVAAVLQKRHLKPLLIGVGTLGGGAILLAYNHALWGGVSVFGGYHQPVTVSGHKVGAFVTGLAGDLVSPERGLLVMTPALLVLLPGIRRAWRVSPHWARWSAVAGIAYLAFQLWGIRFGGGDGFYSYRTTLETLSLCLPMLVLAWREWTSTTRVRRTAFAGLAAASLALHAFGAVVNWVPGGIHNEPWSTYLPVDLAHHVGVAQTAVWLGASAIVVAGAAVFAWRSAGERFPTTDVHATDVVPA